MDDRAGLEDVGVAADNTYVNALAAANTSAQRRAIDVVVAKDGNLMLPSRFNERLPGVAGGMVDCTAFPRLSKLAPGAAGQVPEARIRALASQLQVELPESADLSEGARAKWIWGLSRLARSVTARAVGWLGLAASDEQGHLRVRGTPTTTRESPTTAAPAGCFGCKGCCGVLVWVDPHPRRVGTKIMRVRSASRHKNEKVFCTDIRCGVHE